MGKILRVSIVTTLILISVLLLCSCGDGKLGSAEKGVYIEEHKLYIPRLYGFERIRPEMSDTSKLVLLKKDDAYIWLSLFDGILFDPARDKFSVIWSFAQNRVVNLSYLKGTEMTPVRFEKIEHPTRPYLEQVLLVERLGGSVEKMSPSERLLYEEDIVRFPEGEKRLLANFYTPMGEDVYNFSFSAPTDDFLVFEEAAKKIFFEIQVNIATRPPGT